MIKYKEEPELNSGNGNIHRNKVVMKNYTGTIAIIEGVRVWGGLGLYGLGFRV